MATPAPASTAEAMDMVLTGLRYMAAADLTALTTLTAQAQAECLQTLEQIAMPDVSPGQAPGDTGSLKYRRPCRRRGCSSGGGPGSGGHIA